MTLVDVAVYGAFVAALVALPFSLIGGIKFFRATAPSPKEFPLISTLLVIVPLVSVSVYVGTVKESDREAVVQSLRSIPSGSIVLVDDHLAKDSEAILAALKSVRPVGAHHSHPTEMLWIEIQTQTGSTVLSLGRDSQLPQEYWVFSSPLFEASSGNGIGRIETSTLDAYH